MTEDWTPLELPGLRRISLDEWYADGFVRPSSGERWWLDQCLWDIHNTVEMACRSAAAAGASAVVLYHGIPKLVHNKKFQRVIEVCKELKLIIVICDDNFRREVYWIPPTG